MKKEEVKIVLDFNQNLSDKVAIIPETIARMLIDNFISNLNPVENHVIVENLISKLKRIQFENDACTKAEDICHSFIEINKFQQMIWNNSNIENYVVKD